MLIYLFKYDANVSIFFFVLAKNMSRLTAFNFMIFNLFWIYLLLYDVYINDCVIFERETGFTSENEQKSQSDLNTNKFECV